ncbi:uncharacterized protein [Drosophila kikkawai]|uniref:DUF7775 domain-containing protein n=1 Tax=Drosophila kikkawai TaxID=30033 RepID=A0A6P4HPE4_DROKI|nr:uncharacterized protein LOC108071250 [Drosophila kikkawai]
MEVVAHMVLMRFNMTGFYVVYKNFLPVLQELPYFGYLACFYIFGVENLIAGVNLCTSVQPSMSKEVLRSLISCFVYVISSMLMLFDAESDFKYIKPTKKPNDQLQKPLHPYFKYNHLHSQGMASMVCSGIHMLHFLVALSVLRFSEDTGTEYDLGNVVLHLLKYYQWIWDYINSDPEGATNSTNALGFSSQ